MTSALAIPDFTEITGLSEARDITPSHSPVEKVIGRKRAETKWVMGADGRWVEIEVIRHRVGNGWHEAFGRQVALHSTGEQEKSR